MREWIGRIIMLLQQARSAEWRRRRSRGMVEVEVVDEALSLCFVLCVARSALARLSFFCLNLG